MTVPARRDAAGLIRRRAFVLPWRFMKGPEPSSGPLSGQRRGRDSNPRYTRSRVRRFRKRFPPMLAVPGLHDHDR